MGGDNNIKLFLSIELIGLYFLIPTITLFPVATFLKIATILAAIIYIIVTIIRLKIVPKSEFGFIRPHSWKKILLPFLVFIIFSTILVFLLRRDYLFLAPQKTPGRWLFICFIYSLFSVYPQEIIYRAFFSHRYSLLLKPNSFLIVNGLAFSFAHVVINNWMAYLLTFIGAFVFMKNYQAYKSLILVSFIHTLYGFWIFTVGIGDFFAFPMPKP